MKDWLAMRHCFNITNQPPPYFHSRLIFGCDLSWRLLTTAVSMFDGSRHRRRHCWRHCAVAALLLLLHVRLMTQSGLRQCRAPLPGGWPNGCSAPSDRQRAPCSLAGARCSDCRCSIGRLKAARTLSDGAGASAPLGRVIIDFFVYTSTFESSNAEIHTYVVFNVQALNVLRIFSLCVP